MATLAFNFSADAKAASDLFTKRLCVMGFAMLSLLIMPMLVFRCEYYTLMKQDAAARVYYPSWSTIPSVGEVALGIWAQNGVFVAALLSVSALSYESLMLKSDGWVTLVAVCDGCCGLYLVVEALAGFFTMCNQTGLSASLPAYTVAVTGSSSILGALLLLLAFHGVKLRGLMLKDHSDARRDAESDGQTAVAAAEVVESFEVSFVKEGAYGLRFAELEGQAQLRVKEILPHGCVAKFNQAMPKSAIRAGDLITRINGGEATASALAGAAEGQEIVLSVNRRPCADATSGLNTARICVVSFAMSCFFILPMVVFACEVANWGAPAKVIVVVVMGSLLEEGVFTAILLSFSALSLRSLRFRSDGLLTLVAACEGCCGLLLLAASAMSVWAEADSLYWELLPAFVTVSTASHLILAALLLLLAFLGFRLRAEMLKDRSCAGRALAAAEAAEGAPQDLKVGAAIVQSAVSV